MAFLMWIAILLATIFFLVTRKKIINHKNKKRIQGRSMLHWMNMSVEDRNNLYELEKKQSLDRKKNLLKQIRKEYNLLANSKKNKST